LKKLPIEKQMKIEEKEHKKELKKMQGRRMMKVK
jgi:type III secretory pathway component EscU